MCHTAVCACNPGSVASTCNSTYPHGRGASGGLYANPPSVGQQQNVGRGIRYLRMKGTLSGCRQRPSHPAASRLHQAMALTCFLAALLPDRGAVRESQARMQIGTPAVWVSDCRVRTAVVWVCWVAGGCGRRGGAVMQCVKDSVFLGRDSQRNVLAAVDQSARAGFLAPKPMWDNPCHAGSHRTIPIHVPDTHQTTHDSIVLESLPSALRITNVDSL